MAECGMQKGARRTLQSTEIAARALSLELTSALVSQDSEQRLCDWLVSTLTSHWRPRGLILGLLDGSRRQLLCQGLVGDEPVQMVLGVDDMSHPLAHVLRGAQASVWPSLNSGARVEHPAFQQMLARLNVDCGLCAIPLLVGSGKVLGVLGLLDNSERLHQWHHGDDAQMFAEVFCNQLSLLRKLAGGRHTQSMLSVSVNRARDEACQQVQVARIQQALIGQSSVMRALQQHVRQAAGHTLPVLIQGETGTGKEVVARLLHQCSGRADGPFVVINCAALPEKLIESELFGHQKGAFSDAVSNKTGLVALANGGTLFLDEVGDMSASMQAKLLRVLETRCFRPLGAEHDVYSDFRLIAATHHELERRIADGAFRQDLYHRLCQCVLRVPPLCERVEDIPPLCSHFIAQYCEREARAVVTLAPSLLRQLMQYSFPGNVRELRNLLEVACAHTPPGQPMTMLLLPPEVQRRLSGESPRQDVFQGIDDLRQAVRMRETAVITSRLRQFGGNRQAAADSLNMPTRTFNGKCLRLGIKS